MRTQHVAVTASLSGLLGVASAAAQEGAAASAASRPGAEIGEAPATQVAAASSSAPTSQSFLMPAVDYSGDLWHRPALTGDWLEGRNWLSEHGIRLDAQVVQYLVGNAHGGRSTNGALGYSGTVDYSLNFDFQRMGLWPGGFARIRAETKYGEHVVGDVGSILTPNFNALLPVPGEPGLTTLTEYWIMQFVSEKLGFIAGQVDVTALPGQNVFASDRYEHFMNTAFWQNPVAFTTVSYSTMTAGAFYSPTKWLSGATLVCDSYGTATRSGFSEAFHSPQAVSIIQALTFHIKPFGLEGNQRFNFSYSTRGTSTWMSIRSSSGPEMRFWYFVTTTFEQVHALTGSP